MARTYRARALTSVDYIYRMMSGVVPAQPYADAIRDNYARMFEKVLPKEKDAKGDYLEKIGHALIRIVLKSADHSEMLRLLDMSWHSANALDKWQLNDPRGACCEIGRFIAATERGEKPPGPNEHRRAYAFAMEGYLKSEMLTMDGRAKGYRRDADALAIVGRYRLRPDQLINDALKSLNQPNGQAELAAKFTLFENAGYGMLLGCAVAANLEFYDLKSGAQWTPTQWRIIADHINRPLSKNCVAFGIANHLVARGMVTDPGSIQILQEIAQFHAGSPSANSTRNMFHNLPVIRRGKILRPEQAAHAAHPRWSKHTRFYCADYGFRLARRDFAKWVDITSEFGDPDNHPLNFQAYERTYGRTFGKLNSWSPR